MDISGIHVDLSATRHTAAMRLLRLALPLAATIALAGCEYYVLVGGVGTDNLVRDATGRSLSDRALDDMTGLDCKTINLTFGKPICTEPQKAVTAPPPYCYRSLASAECYTQRDPLPRPTTSLFPAPTGQTR